MLMPFQMQSILLLGIPVDRLLNKLNAHSAANFLCNINIKAYDLIVFIGIAHGLEGSVKTENELSAVKHFLEGLVTVSCGVITLSSSIGCSVLSGSIFGCLLGSGIGSGSCGVSIVSCSGIIGISCSSAACQHHRCSSGKSCYSRDKLDLFHGIFSFKSSICSAHAELSLNKYNTILL